MIIVMKTGAGREQIDPVVLEALIGLGDRQRVGRLLDGERADGRQRVAVAVAAGENRVGNRLAQANVNGLFVLRS